MKKINFEKLSDTELFGSFAGNKLNFMATSKVRGGADSTSTSLCKTVETFADEDSQHSQESLSDSRCKGY
jgi:hypothetical protein